jgi:hypothetical protein
MRAPWGQGCRPTGIWGEGAWRAPVERSSTAKIEPSTAYSRRAWRSGDPVAETAPQKPPVDNTLR